MGSWLESWATRAQTASERRNRAFAAPTRVRPPTTTVLAGCLIGALALAMALVAAVAGGYLPAIGCVGLGVAALWQPLSSARIDGDRLIVRNGLFTTVLERNTVARFEAERRWGGRVRVRAWRRLGEDVALHATDHLPMLDPDRYLERELAILNSWLDSGATPSPPAG